MTQNVSSSTGKVTVHTVTVDVTAGPIAGPIAGALRVRWKRSARA
ncbi:hypothetical protein AB4Y67_11465 [Arthrobacter sp. YAF17]